MFQVLRVSQLVIRKQFYVISISDKLLNEISEEGASESPVSSNLL